MTFKKKYDGINSSKVYCKWICTNVTVFFIFVLIVAKCIVNKIVSILFLKFCSVLIVAKCIVNACLYNCALDVPIVLIVAKCIVNDSCGYCKTVQQVGINSSKVYCK